ncbi:permease [Candidatus Uhrbacteria bacterium]|nr:permease [Candidatus Uhrbacteria bacterium]
MEAILFSFISFISTFCGGLFGIRYRDRLHLIISFTAGVLIAVCFFDILPEIFSMTAEHELSITPAMIALIAGFLAIHILEKLAVIHHSHEDTYAEHKHPMVGYVSAIGLAFHSFLDGVGIGLGFHVSPQVGLLIAIAVIAHDFSDGLNTVSLMLVNKHTIRKALHLLLVDAIAPILGVLATFIFVIPERWLVIYLGFFAGFLLYLGASDLLPEAHSKRSSYKLIGLTILGIVFIFLVTRFT